MIVVDLFQTWLLLHICCWSVSDPTTVAYMLLICFRPDHCCLYVVDLFQTRLLLPICCWSVSDPATVAYMLLICFRLDYCCLYVVDLFQTRLLLPICCWSVSDSTTVAYMDTDMSTLYQHYRHLDITWLPHWSIWRIYYTEVRIPVLWWVQ